MAVKQLDVVMAEGALDCTFGGLTATAHAAADPVHLTAFSWICACKAMTCQDMPQRNAPMPVLQPWQCSSEACLKSPEAARVLDQCR